MIYLTYNLPYHLYNGTFKAEETAMLMEAARDLKVDINTFSSMQDILFKKIPDSYINMNGYVNRSHFRYLKELELLGVRYINNVENSFMADEKYFCSSKLRHNNIPTPQMIDLNQLFGVIQNSKNQITQLINDSIGFPCVLKVPNSGYGNGIFLVKDESEFNDIYAMTAWINPKFGYNETGTDFVVQKYIASSKGRALRIILLDDQYLGCMYRENKLSWKINSETEGSVPSKYDADSELIKTCFKALKVLGLRYAAFDILFDDNEYTINEVNTSPGFKRFHGLYPEINLPRLLISNLI